MKIEEGGIAPFLDNKDVLVKRFSITAISAILFVTTFTAEAAETFRWDINKPFATFKGTTDEQEEQVDTVLQKTSAIDSMTMFIAADTAYVLGRLEDAGFLYNIASARAAFDLERYQEENNGGGNGFGIYLGFLSRNAGYTINKALFDNVITYGEVSLRVADWDCNTIEGYSPGWDYQHVNSSSSSCETYRDERAMPMLQIGVLLRIREYEDAFRVIQKYNLLPYTERESPELKAERDNAIAKMAEIEKKEGFEGFAAHLK